MLSVLTHAILAVRLIAALGVLAVAIQHGADATEGAARGLSPLEYGVFVASKGQSRVSVIDPDLLDVVATIDLGFNATQLVVSSRLKLLAAVDGELPEVRIYDIAAQQLRFIALPFAPTRLVRAPDGTLLAALDTLLGKVAVVDLARGASVVTPITVGAVSDALFSSDGAFLYVAGENRPGVAAIRTEDGTVGALEGTDGTTFAGLSRAPNGRDGYGKLRGSGALQVFDLGRRKSVDRFDAAPDTAFPYITGTGRFLLLPDNGRGELRIATTDPLQLVATVKASTGVTAAYSAWFDSLAFVASPAERRFLVFDLDRFVPLGEVRLDGTPGEATVSPGGDKLFVPLIDAKAVQVIDVAGRRVIGRIPLDAVPTALAMAGGYGICH